MPTSPPAFESLQTMLAAYERALDRVLPDVRTQDLLEADSAFAQLRRAVARHWPGGSVHVDWVGVRANDLVDAAAGGRSLATPYHAHARALFDLRVGLRAAALTSLGWALPAG